jgi:chromosome segregation ATPase
MKQTRIVFLAITILLFTGAAQSVIAQAKTESDDQQTMQQLLAEVRMLRQALQTVQRMSIDTYRSQLLVDRIRVAHEDIRRLTDSLNSTRETLAKTQTTIPQFVERQKLTESLLQAEVDVKRRAELEFELRRVKEATETYKSQIEPLKEREQQLTNELNTAKGKAEDLENRLDVLERAIENDRQRLDASSSPKTPQP